MASLKELAKRQEGLVGGHRACAGCGASAAIRQILLAAGDKPTVCGICTGCMEVVTTIFPFTAWNVNLVHNAFENSAATTSGMEAAYKALKRNGKISEDMNFIAFGGDGGTYDIGLQSLSGAIERGHKMLYVCYDNGAYMNTGYQRSSATPYTAHTTTSPSGSKIPGKQQKRKDLTEIIVAHNPAYAAQTTPGYYMDLIRKVEKALAADGPSFINVLSPCVPGWGYPPEQSMNISKLAVETLFWPLYEWQDGKYKINVKPREPKPVTEFLKQQARFRHIFKPGNEHLVEEIQAYVDKQWERLLGKEEASK
ncbi:pyruvate ferredoxin oxidoreductase [candidate division WOR-3 bacterium]|uniref:Pyruvate ferredoxin oxidoreductase n=1 Tax=candidate division WOR-3 bacterium TaxID=2052148 RepID=A0A9D5QEQ1_UNCW3|nr:pyruvate ferredoxin oxidoreductase [candidate division WOR-3 bacterium]MBD3365250.1 pyruvate ferredoxin oxidoreductase [candidate division WOR-3 bacterium]